MPLQSRRIMVVLLAMGVLGALASGADHAVSAAAGLSPNCLVESLEVCRALPAHHPLFGLCPNLALSLCDSPAAGTSTSTVTSGVVSATVSTTGSATVSLATSTTAQNAQVHTCIQIRVDNVSGAFCEDPQSGPLTYQCDITSDSPDVHGTCRCQASAPDPSPSVCAGLEAGCAQFRGGVSESANGKLCEF
jgi:hypothetical protein